MRFYFAYTALVTVIMTASAAASASSSSSSSGLDEIDPPQTRKTRSLWAKNADSCRTQNDMIVALKEEIENLQLSLNDGGPSPSPPSPSDHSDTLKQLTKSYFLNNDFWFPVPGGMMMETYKDCHYGDAYDNSMAVQFLIREDESTVNRAKEILNAFAHHMYCDSGDDNWRAKKDTTASGERVQLFPRFIPASQSSLQFPFMTEDNILIEAGGNWQGPYQAGNNIYVGLAFAHASTVLAKQGNTGKIHAACYALAAYDIADALLDTRKCPNGDYPRDQDVLYGINTESMADWKGFLNTMNLNGDYDKQVAGTDVLFEKAYNNNPPSYYAGMTCNLSGTDSGFGGVHPADTTFWSAMADAAMTKDKTNISKNMIEAMRYIRTNVDMVDKTSDINTYNYEGFKYNGFKFSTGADAIQWEVTASAGAISMMHALHNHADQLKDEDLYELFKSRKTAYLDSIAYLIERSGFVPGSIQNKGANQRPNLGRWYKAVAHLSASSWSGLALRMDDASASDKDTFNVFAAQKDMMSKAEAKDTCKNIKQTLANSCN